MCVNGELALANVARDDSGLSRSGLNTHGWGYGRIPDSGAGIQAVTGKRTRFRLYHSVGGNDFGAGVHDRSQGLAARTAAGRERVWLGLGFNLRDAVVRSAFTRKQRQAALFLFLVELRLVDDVQAYGDLESAGRAPRRRNRLD